jgi:hypothetical protein
MGAAPGDGLIFEVNPAGISIKRGEIQNEPEGHILKKAPGMPQILPAATWIFSSSFFTKNFQTAL